MKTSGLAFLLCIYYRLMLGAPPAAIFGFPCCRRFGAPRPAIIFGFPSTLLTGAPPDCTIFGPPTGTIFGPPPRPPLPPPPPPLPIFGLPPPLYDLILGPPPPPYVLIFGPPPPSCDPVFRPPLVEIIIDSSSSGRALRQRKMTKRARATVKRTTMRAMVTFVATIWATETMAGILVRGSGKQSLSQGSP